MSKAMVARVERHGLGLHRYIPVLDCLRDGRRSQEALA